MRSPKSYNRVGITINFIKMNLDDFKNNFLSEKDLITQTDLITGGMTGGGSCGGGTVTEETTQTAVIEGFADVFFRLATGEAPPTVDDTSGDWDDEGTC